MMSKVQHGKPKVLNLAKGQFERQANILGENKHSESIATDRLMLVRNHGVIERLCTFTNEIISPFVYCWFIMTIGLCKHFA